MVTITVAMMMVFLASFLQIIKGRSDVVLSYDALYQARYAAEAGLEQAKNYIRTSAYNASGNIWLNSTSSFTMTLNNMPVTVTVTSLGTGWHRLVATARTNNFDSSVSFEVRGRDSFSRYMFFTSQDYIAFGTTTVHGDVHSNQYIRYNSPGAKMYDDVTAVTGIVNPGNATFYGEVNGYAATIPWPTTSEIATLENDASGVYRVTNASPEYSGFGTFNTEIEFINNQVMITAKRISDGAVLKTGTYPLPANNLIFVQNNVTSIKGDINGRITVATMGKVDVTGKIRYKDNQGDLAYQLKRYGVVTDPDSTGTLAWTEANGFTYEPNPAYNPGDTPSVCAIMAQNDVTIMPTAPYNMEFHASTFSSQGRWKCDLTQQKGNLRVLGSQTQKYRGWRYSGTWGWAKSGEYIYDSYLLNYPPSYYLQVDSPCFGAWWRN